VIAVTQAMVMGAVVTHGVFLPAFLSFALPAMLPMIFVSAMDGGTQNTVLAIYSTIFLALMIGAAVRFNKSIRDTWKVRFENDDLVKALTEAHDHLALQAQSDGLTGIANRRRFDEVLETEFSRLRRSGAPLSLIFLDVDCFKAYNDSYGHLEGDQCLRKIAMTLQQQLLRASDFVARYGGEEFAVILPETGHIGAMSLAENIRSEVAALKIPHCASQVNSCVTVSLGVITLDCNEISSSSEALSLADRQLYLAKAGGRNRVAALDLIDEKQAKTTIDKLSVDATSG
jgi:diguanylate cyclase (GGDEF)-like protein